MQSSANSDNSDEEDFSSDEDGDDIGVTSIFTVDEMMIYGLRLGGYTQRRIDRSQRKTNVERFKSLYGSTPRVITIIWEDLQTTSDPAAHVQPCDRKIKFFLMAMHQLKRYPTEFEREAKFDVNIAWSRDWTWFFIEKIQALKVEKIRWPDDNFGNDIWVVSVDGTHCWIEEPIHPTWSQDSKYFSHKYGKAGMSYELAISLNGNRLVWLHGPFPAGTNDVTIFKKKGGLKTLLRRRGKMAIGDGGYSGHPYQVSTFNRHDTEQCRKFKSRALKRHERFNGLTKAFDCLSGRFRHKTSRFKTCFEAVCVICQYQIETDYPLFNILIEELMD